MRRFIVFMDLGKKDRPQIKMLSNIPSLDPQTALNLISQIFYTHIFPQGKKKPSKNL